MFTRHKPQVRFISEPTHASTNIVARIERLRVLSVHDKELARLLDEVEPYFKLRADPSPRPIVGTQLDLL